MATLTINKKSPRLKEIRKQTMMSLNKKQKAQRNHRIKKAKAWLNSFSVIENSLPLKTGILQDINFHRKNIKVTGFGSTHISTVLNYHCSNKIYLENIKAGEPRYNLQGDEDGIITQREEIHSNNKLIEKQRVKSWTPHLIESNKSYETNNT